MFLALAKFCLITDSYKILFTTSSYCRLLLQQNISEVSVPAVTVFQWYISLNFDLLVQECCSQEAAGMLPLSGMQRSLRKAPGKGPHPLDRTHRLQINHTVMSIWL